ncbi:double-strand break repair helicase AddA [Sphingomicrobium clamense]|uniref:DNA 3'-5' helicase n=1 Tax=Sphingomicrobium clamense TaxID=2851013 RepID=A0ABS6V672_9SPHN|nr:double-strand break repair helicase AddA [Sphingomicrobium sp. B8]MBW0145065.1 double-strand break repair helicase AddA [Sphingomicrobium sp. B8]
MSRRFKPLDTLLGNQAAASDPSAHAALSASAGTGKTHVLTARVLRLLLQGVPPEAILCLTFTKAAAAEMANRIGGRLASWARLDDARLGLELAALYEPNDPPTRERARRLFATVLEAPGGLKIQTIHAFSQALLSSFPAEAGIAPGFEPLDERGEEELARQVLADVASEAAASPMPQDRQFLEDLKTLSLRLGEQGAVDYLRSAARHPAAMRDLPDDDAIDERVRLLVGLPEGEIDAYLAEQCNDFRFDRRLCDALIEVNRAWGTKTGSAVVDRLKTWLELPDGERMDGLSEMAKDIVTQKGEPSKKQKDQALAARLADRVAELSGLKARAAMARAQAAALRAGKRFSRAYEAAKRAAAVADFDDLIRWTRGLLDQPGVGDWIRFKLDHRIDHVLVDEAQDTNGRQWAIIRALVDEYFSGADEAEDRWRTLFMVGDFKQAIYRFQGADPKEFVAVRKLFDEKSRELAAVAGDADRPRAFRDLDISKSFRSAGAILDVTDQVIEEVGAEAMGLPRHPPPHETAHPNAHGQVEWWPAFSVADAENGEEEGEESWVELRDRLYADALADAVAGMVGEGTAPGDILILLRRRSELASLIVARLYSAHVPVAGVDRLFLSRPLAVRDLIAAMAFASQPDDDLTLACLLTSPLVGWDHDKLYGLAFGRGNDVSLWRALRDRREDFADAHATLSQLLADADYLLPSAFLEKILSGPMQGRAKLIGRLGLEARDPIEELVNSAFDFESDATPSLDEFLAAMRRGEVEVKREAGEAGNAVRVMTVHGAKGLEAPVVILADATADPERMGGVRSTVEVATDEVERTPFLRPRKDELCEPFTSIIEQEKEEEREEHWRLLYVALTRAASRLIVTGTAPKNDKPVAGESWHAMVARAMVSLGAASLDAPWGEGGLIHQTGSKRMRPARRKRAAEHPPRPAWIDAPAPPEARPPRPLVPSAVEGEEELLFPPPSAGDRTAARRGILIHALLERLPPVAAAQRRATADRWLATAMGVGDADHRRDMIDAALSVIDDPVHAALFGPHALAEAPIAATLPDGRVVAGTADRLLVETDRILVVDFKTGHQVPGGAADVPTAHRAQMRSYIDALRVIFPDRTVEGALLYTAGPTLIRLDA